MKVGDCFLGYCRDGDNMFLSKITKIGKSTEGINKSDIVSFTQKGHRVIGFLKYDGSEFTNNSLEFALYQMSHMLPVNLAKTIRVYGNRSLSTPVATISVDVTNNNEFKYVSFRQMRDELFVDFKNNLIPRSKWIEDWMEIRSRKKDNKSWEIFAFLESDYANCLQFPFEISKRWCAKYELDLQNFSSSIARMIMFDILIGQSDRSPSNYGLLINYVTSSAKLAPLFDNGTITKPYIELSKNSFNQLLLNRKELASASYSMLGVEFRSAVQHCLRKQSKIYNFVQKLKNDLTQESYNLLTVRIEEGITLFGKLCY